MSRYFSKSLSDILPYTPGEQPDESESFVKLNTNESPYPPSPLVMEKAREVLRDLRLYPDPEAGALREKIASLHHVEPASVIVGNGSDEILFFAMRAFCDSETQAVFPDITYGFYSVLAGLCAVPTTLVPLSSDFSVRVRDYAGVDGTLFLANPNAPTGRALPLSDIIRLIEERPDFVTIIDEAYVDFGGESAAELTGEYDSLIVTRTFSKSRSLAGARVGYAIAGEALIRDMDTVRRSLNPYNLGSPAQALALGALSDEEGFRRGIEETVRIREETTLELTGLGFHVIPSAANFVFATHPALDGRTLYRELKARGVLVRHFDGERTGPFVRITIGRSEEMKILIEKIKEILDSGGVG